MGIFTGFFPCDKIKKKKKVFLGGTCNDSTWRDELIEKLKIDYFNPVVEDWTPEDGDEEVLQRQICDYCLYTITPEMKGVFSIFEIGDDSNKRPDKTIVCLIRKANGKRFDIQQWKSLENVAKRAIENGCKVFYDLNDVANYLNGGQANEE